MCERRSSFIPRGACVIRWIKHTHTHTSFWLFHASRGSPIRNQESMDLLSMSGKYSTDSHKPQSHMATQKRHFCRKSVGKFLACVLCTTKFWHLRNEEWGNFFIQSVKAIDGISYSSICAKAALWELLSTAHWLSIGSRDRGLWIDSLKAIHAPTIADV